MPLDITMLFTYYLHILHHLYAMKMTFLKLFIICPFKEPNVEEKKGQIRGNFFFKLNSAEVMEFVFSRSDLYLSTLLSISDFN